jgi:hypothetical protein
VNCTKCGASTLTTGAYLLDGDTYCPPCGSPQALDAFLHRARAWWDAHDTPPERRLELEDHYRRAVRP